MADIIEIGNRIELSKILIDKTAEKKNYISQVLDIKDAHEMNIAMPIQNNRIIPLDIGDQYRLCFFTKKGMYQCKAEIINRYREGQLGILVIQLLTDPVRLQRRQYFRLSCVMDIAIHNISPDEEAVQKVLQEKNYANTTEMQAFAEQYDTIHNENWFEVTLVDISGGGARFFSQKEIDISSLISMCFPGILTETGKALELDGRLIACQPIPDRKLFEYRAEFYNVSAKERENLVKYIFEEERKQRKKEKGLE
ncbi:MAG: flagellar brake domain-containing protein [Clostridiales bacterium]|nr:flagellar brake domain-containing protein [Clostridiales bacterium]